MVVVVEVHAIHTRKQPLSDFLYHTGRTSKCRQFSQANGCVEGNLDPEKLAKLRHYNCRKTQEEIARALTGNNRADYLFGLKQEYESYQFFQKKIEQCDKQINAFLQTQINICPEKLQLHTDNKPHKRLNKNAIKGIDLNQAAFQYFGGVDLMQIEGISQSKNQ